MRYKHFTKDERNEISVLLNKDYSIRDISYALGRNPSSVSREIAKNSVKGQYDPEKAKTAKAQADLQIIRSVLALLFHDTGQHPDHIGFASNCDPEGGPEEYLNTCTAGLECNSGFTNWQGPYIQDVPTDPWGNNYIFDADFVCNTGVKGCEGLPNNTNTRSIHSGGPNGSGINGYDSDNIVLVICTY